MSDDDREETTLPLPAEPPSPPSEFAYPTIGTEKVLDGGILPDPAEDRDK
ncbi:MULTISPECIES: hypothetical protein [Actinomycetes]|nr:MULTISPECIES: hypothetical protein [Actinomycetes]